MESRRLVAAATSLLLLLTCNTASGDFLVPGSGSQLESGDGTCSGSLQSCTRRKVGGAVLISLRMQTQMVGTRMQKACAVPVELSALMSRETAIVQVMACIIQCS